MKRAQVIFFSLIFIFIVKDVCSALVNTPNKKILILGNSLTKHGPAPKLGWLGNWGMAATAESKDYVHILMQYSIDKREPVTFSYANIPFEAEFWKYDLTKLVDYKNSKPDILIIELGDNVKDSLAVRHNYEKHLASLANYLKKTNNIKVILLGTWGNRSLINKRIASAASANRWIYLPINDIEKDRSNTAKGLFENKGVAFHPSDKGMAQIAQKIRKVIEPFIN